MTILQFLLAHFLYDLLIEISNRLILKNEFFYKIIVKDRMKKNKKSSEIVEKILDEEFETCYEEES